MKLELWYAVKPLGINQLFGNPDPKYTAMGLNGHNGIDFQAYHGQSVYSPIDGVCYPEVDPGGGNGVVIRTSDPFEYNGQHVYFKVILWHLVKSDAVVRTGQQVKIGDLIGYADNTGMSTGDHLHFGLKPQAWNENDWTWYNTDQTNGFLGAIDPTPYFNKYFAEDYGTVIQIYVEIIESLKKVIDLFSSLKK